MKPAEAKQVKVGQYIQSVHTGFCHRVESIEECKEHFYFKCTDGSRIHSLDVVPTKRGRL